MIRRIFILIFILVQVQFLQAQEVEEQSADIQVGDTLRFGSCKGENFNYIDLYAKTRFEETELTYDSATGEGFYEYYFNTGDMDVSRLPCDYANTKCVITAINFVLDDAGKERLVIFATIKAGEKVAWIEAQEAFNSGEVVWLR